MIYSRIGRSLSRASRPRNVINVESGRSLLLNKEILGAQHLYNSNYIVRKVGFLRGYLATTGAKNGSIYRSYLSNSKQFIADARIRRFFSSEAPKKKNYGNFYPRQKKEVPKQNEQKSGSKEERNTDDHGNFQDTFIRNSLNIVLPALALALVVSLIPHMPHEEKQISFQEFKNKLLEPGLVDHVVVSNKSVAKVYVRSSPRSLNSNDTTEESKFEEPVGEAIASEKKSQYKYYFNIGSVDSFEEKLEEAQVALGIDRHDYVHVTYVSEMVWFQELMRFAPSILLLGFLFYMGGKMQGGIGVGGTGGKGARGIFNIGKAQITKVDKNAKNKVPSYLLRKVEKEVFWITTGLLTRKSMSSTLISKLKPGSSSLDSLGYQFMQRCSVSGTAKGKGKIKTGQPLKRSKVTTKKGVAAVSSQQDGPRKRSEMDEMVEQCLTATPPLRFLKPKERAREAEREKMGLVSKGNEQAKHKLKKLGKDFDSPFIMGTPGMDLISLGLVDADKIPNYELTVEDGRRLAKEYSRVLMRKHRVRQTAESTLLQLKKEAIEALPENLKVAALVPDLTPFPINRFMATLTPPIEGYIEKINEAARKSSGKEKLR